MDVICAAPSAAFVASSVPARGPHATEAIAAARATAGIMSLRINAPCEMEESERQYRRAFTSEQPIQVGSSARQKALGLPMVLRRWLAGCGILAVCLAVLPLT